MAIEYIKAKPMSRSHGANAVSASAYRSNTKLFDNSIGKTFDFTHKTDCIYANIVLPDTCFNNEFSKENHPFNHREQLWNAVEEIEYSHNRAATARVGYELQVALPKELDEYHNIKLINEFVKKNYVEKFNVAADICIHDKGDGNPHAHVMLTPRSIDGIELSKTKERSILPAMKTAEGSIFSQVDGLNKKYRDFQNNFFKENNIELVVDQNGINPLMHMERNAGDKQFVKEHLEYNNLVMKANLNDVSQDHNSIIDTLSKRQSTFNKSDIETLTYKCTLLDPESYEVVLNKVLSSSKLISLGYSTAGRYTYTTQENYNKDMQLLEITNDLSGRRNFDVSEKTINAVSVEKTLKEEQGMAIKHIAHDGDISCLVGYAGAGKTYTMNALNEIYKQNDIKVYGTSVSGKAVQGLQDEAGIASVTIAKILHDYKQGNYEKLPSKYSVLVVDEASMVCMDDMVQLMKISQERRLKLVLVGDPEQLESIGKGNPFKAILEKTGFAVMKEITRQQDDGDKKATVNLGERKTGLAIDHYYDKGCVHIQSTEDNHQSIIAKYNGYLDETFYDSKISSERNFDTADTLMLAYTRADVEALNDKARDTLLDRGLVSHGIDIAVNLDNKYTKKKDVVSHTHTKNFGAGERILFLKGAIVEDGVEIKNGLFCKHKKY